MTGLACSTAGHVAKAMALTVYDLLVNPDTLAAAKAEFASARK